MVKTMHDSKVCFKCEQEKPLTEFYRHKTMFDGYVGKCKECTKKDVKDNRDKNNAVLKRSASEKTIQWKSND